MKKLASVFLILSSLYSSAQSNKYNRFPDLQNKIGTHFPIEFFLDNTGKNYTSKYLSGKPTFINFWSTTCEPCIEELPQLNKLQKEVGDKANFISITYDSKEKVHHFLLKKQFNFQHITDALLQLQTYFPVIRNPISFIIGKNGNVKEIYGSVNEDNLQTIIKSLR